MTEPLFSSLNLPENLVANLDSLGYLQMTPIQAKALPLILAGKDVIGQAKTGSGKTAAFGLGILAKLQVERFRIQSLVLCPTRELADQVASELRKLARRVHNIKILTLCGGAAFGPQVGSLEHGAHIIVGTPGRVQDHLRKGNLNLQDVDMLVLDEADRMLEMGFQPALEAILKKMPSTRQSLLFSATFSEQVESIAMGVMRTPERVKVDADNSDNHNITQHFYKVEQKQRSQALQLLLMQYQPESCVIFCNTRAQTQQLCDELAQYGFSVLSLHGDLEQRERDQVLIRFSNKSVSILVATDVAARGLDIDDLDAVVNYEMAHDLEVHVHRVGRTGRAGKSGNAFTLVGDREIHKLKLLESYLNKNIEFEALPAKSVLQQKIPQSPMITVQIDAGKKNKIRPGDVLGALTGEHGINGNDVGKIKITHFHAYVAIKRSAIKAALEKLSTGQIKGRNFRVRTF